MCVRAGTADGVNQGLRRDLPGGVAGFSAMAAHLIDAQVVQLLQDVPGASVQDRVVVSGAFEKLTLTMSYCGAPLSFLVTFYESSLDLVPLEGVPEEAIYDVFSVDALGSMQSWTPADVRGLSALAAELADACATYHRERVENFPVASVQFNCEAVKHRPGIEMRVVQGNAGGGAIESGDVHLLFPLGDTLNDAEAADALADMGAKVHVSILRGGTATDVRLQLARSDRMPLTRSFTVPKWSPQEPLWDYLQTLRTSLEGTWLKRRQLVEALVATFR